MPREHTLYNYRLQQLLWAGLDWLYPPVCGGCDKAGFRWCPDCQKQAHPVPGPLCEVCGLPQPSPGVCAACQASPPPFRALRSWAVFEGPLRSAIHSLKYRRNLALGEALARPLAEFARSFDWPVEAVVPVPLGIKRLRERGYNQVELIAMPMAAYNHWRFAPQAVKRVRDTVSQVGLSMIERQENMRGAFRADPKQVSGRSVLVVDDVATTGATLSACSEAILSAGARQVFALTLAKTLPHHGLKDV